MRYRPTTSAKKAVEPPLFVVIVGMILKGLVDHADIPAEPETCLGLASVLYGIYRGCLNWVKHS